MSSILGSFVFVPVYVAIVRTTVSPLVSEVDVVVVEEDKEMCYSRVNGAVKQWSNKYALYKYLISLL